MKTSRREFLKKAGLALATFPIVFGASNISLQCAEAQPLVPVNPETDPVAKALGYFEDASKVDTTKYPKRKAPEGSNQFCKTCVLLQQGGMKIPGKEGDWGKCSLYQSGLVNVNGWCMSWALKPS